jgi:multiple sugar transport system ATP-binding protein
VLKDGLLQQIDAPQVLYEKPANIFVAGFIGSPAMNFFDAKLAGTNEEMYVETDTFKVRVPPEKAAKLGQYLGQEVVFGIRPEDISDCRFAPDAPDDVCFLVKVDVVELMGNEYYLYLLSDDKSFVGRVDYQTLIRPGDELKVALNMDHMHVFDAKTQVALT